MIFGREPAVIITFIRYLVYLGVLFGLDLTDEQMAGIFLVIEAGFVVWTREKVSPVDKNGVIIPKRSA